METIAAVLLAAGLSRRFGSADKLARPLGGKALALHAAETLAALPLGRKFAVCAAASGVVPEGLARLGFEIVVNPDPARGQGSSIATGIAAAEAWGAEAALICLADMPQISAGLLSRIAAQWRADPEGPVATAAGEYRGPPAIFPRAAFPALRQLSGDRGAKALLAGARLVEAAPAELKDFDVPGDFAGGETR